MTIEVRPAPEITVEEFRHRRSAVWAGAEAAGLSALAVFYPARIAYLTGFHHVPTERPLVLVLGPDGKTVLVVPAVEKEHAESVPGVERVEVYFDYPGERHPLERLAQVLRSLVGSSSVGADHDGVVPYWGYRGPRLSELLGAPVGDGEMLVESLRRRKSAAELECIQVSCEWAARGHRRMQDAIRPGATELECYAPAELETLREMIRSLPGWRPRSFGGNGVTAMFVGGRKTAYPHGFVRGHGLQPGDVLVSGASTDIDGYHSELERTMFVGEPNSSQRDAFAKMLALQTRAIEVLRPGLPMADVDREVAGLAGELGCADRLRHHVGHSIGLEGHEAPFLDRGEEAVLEPGMVLTIEPGLYFPELGGFRHSDTVCVTDSGHRVMTDYPRELEELVIPV
ncbi:MAG: Xaa-Pro peptidase family protein [Candidatus Dormibacteraeota bacterium]|nr:Xaa-Pro peptidase family protein [Candidatus Dormibacteraeota bacterium]